MDCRIELAVKFMERNCQRRLTARVIADELGLSHSRFEHLFTRETGTTFREHLREIRLARGSVLLANPRLRIKEVSAECGYSTTAAFTRAFKARLGLSPSAFSRGSLGTAPCPHSQSRA